MTSGYTNQGIMDEDLLKEWRSKYPFHNLVELQSILEFVKSHLDNGLISLLEFKIYGHLLRIFMPRYDADKYQDVSMRELMDFSYLLKLVNTQLTALRTNLKLKNYDLVHRPLELLLGKQGLLNRSVMKYDVVFGIKKRLFF
jgi:hypothetical protein